MECVSPTALAFLMWNFSQQESQQQAVPSLELQERHCRWFLQGEGTQTSKLMVRWAVNHFTAHAVRKMLPYVRNVNPQLENQHSNVISSILPQKAQTAPVLHSGLHVHEYSTATSSWQCLSSTVSSDWSPSCSSFWFMPSAPKPYSKQKKSGIHTTLLRFISAGMPSLFLWTWNPEHMQCLPAFWGTSMVFNNS